MKQKIVYSTYNADKLIYRGYVKAYTYVRYNEYHQFNRVVYKII